MPSKSVWPLREPTENSIIARYCAHTNTDIAKDHQLSLLPLTSKCFCNCFVTPAIRVSKSFPPPGCAGPSNTARSTKKGITLGGRAKTTINPVHHLGELMYIIDHKKTARIVHAENTAIPASASRNFSDGDINERTVCDAITYCTRPASISRPPSCRAIWL